MCEGPGDSSLAYRRGFDHCRAGRAVKRARRSMPRLAASGEAHCRRLPPRPALAGRGKPPGQKHPPPAPARNFLAGLAPRAKYPRNLLIFRGFFARPGFLCRRGGLYVRGKASAHRARGARVTHDVSIGQPRRQIRPRPDPRPGHRLSRAGPRPADAEGARPPRRPQHRRLRHRLSRLAARRPRPADDARRPFLGRRRRQVLARHQRGARRHRALGHAAGRAARRGQVRWRLRHVVRQGPGRRSFRRRLPPRQHGRHLQARRRSRLDGRRPHRRILHHRASVRIPFRRRDDADSQSGRRAGDHRLCALWLGDVALHRHLDRAQMHA